MAEAGRGRLPGLRGLRAVHRPGEPAGQDRAGGAGGGDRTGTRAVRRCSCPASGAGPESGGPGWTRPAPGRPPSPAAGGTPPGPVDPATSSPQRTGAIAEPAGVQAAGPLDAPPPRRDRLREGLYPRLQVWPDLLRQDPRGRSLEPVPDFAPLPATVPLSSSASLRRTVLVQPW